MSLPLTSIAEEPYTDSRESVQLVINGQKVFFENPIYLENQRIFVPVKHVVDYLGGQISWDGVNKQVLISTSNNDQILFSINSSIMKFNDKEYVMDVNPFIVDERTYVPIRHAAEFLHADVTWDSESRTATITSTPLITVGEEDSLISLSEKLEVSVDLLMERNELSESSVTAGDQLRVIIPTIMSEKILIPDPPSEAVFANNIEEDPDYILLTKIIQVEAGYESYEGQLAVGSVIMNRVKHSDFPNSIREVVYQAGQFPPAHNGLLDKSVPNESVKLAAKAVLNGENNVEDALFFYNPRVSTGSYWDTLTTVIDIGNHRFKR